MINFRFQLNAQYFISVTMLLYMFRALLRPSSGRPLYIYNIWFYVSLFWWPCSWKFSEGLQSLTNLLTARSPKETNIEPDVVNIQRSSWGWEQECPKHVEEHSYWNKILCIKLEPEVNQLEGCCEDGSELSWNTAYLAMNRMWIGST
jgi:hypothetical protein